MLISVSELIDRLPEKEITIMRKKELIYVNSPDNQNILIFQSSIKPNPLTTPI
jgi:hypothetical protein